MVVIQLAKLDRPFALGGLAAGSVMQVQLCLGSNRQVVPGDFELLFSFRYEWAHRESRQQALEIVVKQVKVGLLGTESVGGVSLQFLLRGVSFDWKGTPFFQSASHNIHNV